MRKKNEILPQPKGLGYLNKMEETIFQNEQECLKAIIKLHCPEGIELDPMYFKGNFYKEVSKPKYIFDINPQNLECEKADARELPLEDNSVKTIILDPPFLFEIRKRINKNYGANTHGILKGFTELESLYKGILKEAYRVLKIKGFLIFKCQDFTDSKTTMTHCFVWKWALEQGFYPKDLAILHLPKNKVYNSNLKQRHFRKTHSYFWIFQKLNSEVRNSSQAYRRLGILAIII